MASTSTTAAPPAGGRAVLRRLSLAVGGGQALDGYDRGAVTVVLPLLALGGGASPVEAGLIGASSLIGILLGAPLTGWLTGRTGRRPLFLLAVALVVVLAAAQPLARDAGQLVVLRLLLGLALGADFALGPPLLAEFLPADRRGRRGAALMVWWYGGFLVAVAAGYLLLAVGVPWTWVLASSALPAAGTLLLRLGLPESPRWLAGHGRAGEARRVLRLLGDDARLAAELAAEPAAGPAGFRALFSPAYRGRTAFACLFWTCLVAPYFALATFIPQVLAAFGLDQRSGTLAVNGVAAAGALAGVALIERTGRRRLLIGPFWIGGTALAVLGLWTGAPAAVVVACFLAFAFTNAASADLCAVYPSELFPTELRSAGVGLAAAASRLGAAAGTFLLPVALATSGVGPGVLAAAGVCAVGALAAQRWAPETAGRALTATGRVSGPVRPPGPTPVRLPAPGRGPAGPGGAAAGAGPYRGSRAGTAAPPARTPAR